jgi:predicted lipopolysaccharide heptosyltransferase III
LALLRFVAAPQLNPLPARDETVGKSFDRRRVNILLIQLKRIGDLILTTPAIAALHKKFPDARISVIVSAGCAELLPGIPGIDHGLVANSARSWFELARGNFDYCVDFTRNDRSSFLTRLSRAKMRIASERRKQRSTIRSRAYNKFVIAPVRQLHTVDYHLRLLEPFHVRDAAPEINLSIPQEARAKADRLRAAHKIREGYILFHPGSARAEKSWEPQRWAEVIDCARERHRIDLILSSGRSPLEQSHLAEIKSKLQRPILDLSGQTDLLTLAALIEKARLLVTVDSAPLHLAAATRTPQVALFGPTNPFHWRPRDSVALILQGTSTTPLREFSPDQPRVPMKQISTRTVINAMNALLSTPTAQGS